MKVLCSWSGGKDGCLAMHRARSAGHEPVYLINSILGEQNVCSFHGVGADVIKRQAELLSLPLKQVNMPADMCNYREIFQQGIKDVLKECPDIEGMVFGDIYLEEHRVWVEETAAGLGLKALLPLWGDDTEKLYLEFIESGFISVIVSAHAEKLGADFPGKILDRPTLEEFKKKGIDVCGENGEYHTLVIDGPGFSSPLKIISSERIFKKGYWDHWNLKITAYS